MRIMVGILLDNDYRVKFCTLHEKDRVWEHDNKKCPKCVCLRILGLDTMY
jgi:hypothetical protein